MCVRAPLGAGVCSMWLRSAPDGRPSASRRSSTGARRTRGGGGPTRTRTTGSCSTGDGPAPAAGPQAGSQGGGQRPHVSVIIDLAALQARWDGDARAASPAPPGHGPTGGLLGNGERICSETARRICCDAGVSRVLTRPGPAILEFGRSRRTTSRAQRRYLDVRDGGCVFPHCGKPPALCDAHHLIFWADQDHPGDTDVDNLALLCWAHHVAVHEGGWTLQRLPDHGGWQATRGAVINAWAGPPNRHGASSTANAASAPTSPPHTGVSHHRRPTRSDDGDTARFGHGGPTRTRPQYRSHRPSRHHPAADARRTGTARPGSATGRRSIHPHGAPLMRRCVTPERRGGNAPGKRRPRKARGAPLRAERRPRHGRSAPGRGSRRRARSAAHRAEPGPGRRPTAPGRRREVPVVRGKALGLSGGRRETHADRRRQARWSGRQTA